MIDEQSLRVDMTTPQTAQPSGLGSSNKDWTTLVCFSCGWSVEHKNRQHMAVLPRTMPRRFQSGDDD